MGEYRDACGMFKGGIYENMVSLPWEFVRRIHGIGNHVVRKMLSFTRIDRLTFMTKVR